jgi:hypothetical protein
MDGLGDVFAAVCIIPRRVKGKIENIERLIEGIAVRTTKRGRLRSNNNC